MNQKVLNGFDCVCPKEALSGTIITADFGYKGNPEREREREREMNHVIY
jgi:hypothetical protein